MFSSYIIILFYPFPVPKSKSDYGGLYDEILRALVSALEDMNGHATPHVSSVSNVSDSSQPFIELRYRSTLCAQLVTSILHFIVLYSSKGGGEVYDSTKASDDDSNSMPLDSNHCIFLRQLLDEIILIQEKNGDANINSLPELQTQYQSSLQCYNLISLLKIDSSDGNSNSTTCEHTPFKFDVSDLYEAKDIINAFHHTSTWRKIVKSSSSNEHEQ